VFSDKISSKDVSPISSIRCQYVTIHRKKQRKGKLNKEILDPRGDRDGFDKYVPISARLGCLDFATGLDPRAHKVMPLSTIS